MRQARVVELFSRPSAAALNQAKRIVRRGPRFNLTAVGSSFDRTINLPMAALAFLRESNQSRASFSRDAYESVGGARMAVVSFKETARPRLVGSPDEAAATGKFWIEPMTGQVRRSLLSIESRRGTTVVVAAIRVDYVTVPSLGLWLPKVMEEAPVLEWSDAPAHRRGGGSRQLLELSQVQRRGQRAAGAVATRRDHGGTHQVWWCHPFGIPLPPIVSRGAVRFHAASH